MRRVRKVGYQGRDSVSHRKYDRNVALKRYEMSGKLTYRGTKRGGKVIYGLGHDAGEAWGDTKDINPFSPEHKYSKNSPSFDEGVWLSKRKRMLAGKM